MAERHFENRVRFNWGYWDGAGEAFRGQANRMHDGHHDDSYRIGYECGYCAAKHERVGDSSEAAWQDALGYGMVVDDRAA